VVEAYEALHRRALDFLRGNEESREDINVVYVGCVDDFLAEPPSGRPEYQSAALLDAQSILCYYEGLQDAASAEATEAYQRLRSWIGEHVSLYTAAAEVAKHVYDTCKAECRESFFPAFCRRVVESVPMGMNPLKVAHTRQIAEMTIDRSHRRLAVVDVRSVHGIDQLLLRHIAEQEVVEQPLFLFWREDGYFVLMRNERCVLRGGPFDEPTFRLLRKGRDGVEFSALISSYNGHHGVIGRRDDDGVKFFDEDFNYVFDAVKRHIAALL